MSMKRPNGTGSVSLLKDGRYCVTFTDPDGKRIYRYRRNRKDAELVLAKLIASGGNSPLALTTANSTTVGGNTPTLLAWSQDWLASQEGRLRNATYQTYKRIMARVVLAIGAKTLASLTPALLTVFFSDLRKRGVGDRQAQQTYTVLRTCLESAVKLDVLIANPMHRVDKPRWERLHRDYWSVDETKQFIETALASSRRYAPLMALLVSTGLRVSEALGLEWTDVNLDLKQLHVRRALVWVYSDYKIDIPKTKAGLRTIALPSPALQALRRYAETTTAEGKTPSGPVFRGKTGQPPNNSNLRRLLLDLCQEAGVPTINIHGLRHVAATMALKATGDIHAVQRRLGHANVSITMSIYAYALKDDSDVSDAVDRLLGGKPEPEPPQVSAKTRRDVSRFYRKERGTAG